MNFDDYIFYFCASGYNDAAITVLTGKPIKCSSPLPSVLDVNYPAITIPNLNGEVTVTRTVTNVGPVDSVYRAVVEAPEGVKIAVEPETLVFNNSTKKLGFKVRVARSHKSELVTSMVASLGLMVLEMLSFLCLVGLVFDALINKFPQVQKKGKIMGGGNKFQEPVKISRRRQVRKEKEEDEVNESFKSPNLEAERRRREKLHGRLMALRSHVPIVTNMTKASIVEDAITYIGELQKIVQNLTEKLHEMEETPLEIYEQQTVHTIKPEVEAIDLKVEMKKMGIEENVQFCKIGKRKFWLKITTEKRPGIFTKFMEVMCLLGFEIIDITLATSNGAIIICSSVQILQGLCDGDSVDPEQTKDFLLEVMRSNP
ncbi:hypothetical protein IGI04_001139 [Brassica rapa subsp. trilocularis]|uniref:BHLH domain-containing protein n=2 Tax=Brassica campestris TaxID=3711 RepID=A0ABQ7NRU4_BRACM|nr:hypothetical protein IGI04_001139 [Brassica rapa subsp. trilocularis]